MDTQHNEGKMGGYCPSCLKGKDDCTCLRDSMKIPVTPPTPVSRTAEEGQLEEFIYTQLEDNKTVPYNNRGLAALLAMQIIRAELYRTQPVVPTKTAEEILEPYRLHLFPEVFGDMSGTDKVSWDGAIKAMDEYKNQFVGTQPEEREERVRIAGEAWDAGMEHEYEKHFGAVPPLSPNKEQYLSQIK